MRALMFSSRRGPRLQRLRRFRRGVVWLFVTLVLLVSAERRIAELHFNLRAACTAVENEDSLDADEIRTRLIVLNDEKVPTVPEVTKLVAAVLPSWGTRPIFFVADSSVPRGPPAVRSFLI